MEPTKTYIIYKIICNTLLADDQIYIGSTCNFATRKSVHKTYCNNVKSNSHHYKVYQIIRANGGWDNWRMDYVEQLPNHTLVQSKIREQYYINLFKSKLNSCNAYGLDLVALAVTQQEYRDTHKKELKQYQQKNKEHIRETKKEYHQNHKERINETIRNNYYKNLAKLREKSQCDCGGHYQHTNKAKHFNTKLHQSYLSCLPVEHDLAVVGPVLVTP